MSDTALALLITVLGLLALAAWVPLLHAAQNLTIRLGKDDATPPTLDEEGQETREAA